LFLAAFGLAVTFDNHLILHFYRQMDCHSEQSEEPNAFGLAILKC